MKQKSLLDFIKEGVDYNGIYCDEMCAYKNYEWCNLFTQDTGYNYRKDLPKRCKLCIKYLGKKPIKETKVTKPFIKKLKKGII